MTNNFVMNQLKVTTNIKRIKCIFHIKLTQVKLFNYFAASKISYLDLNMLFRIQLHTCTIKNAIRKVITDITVSILSCSSTAHVY